MVYYSFAATWRSKCVHISLLNQTCLWDCRIDLELLKAADVMRSPVITIMSQHSLYLLAQLLLDTSHGGFPVVQVNHETGAEVVYGLITRSLLSIAIITVVVVKAAFRVLL